MGCACCCSESVEEHLENVGELAVAVGDVRVGAASPLSEGLDDSAQGRQAAVDLAGLLESAARRLRLLLPLTACGRMAKSKSRLRTSRGECCGQNAFDGPI